MRFGHVFGLPIGCLSIVLSLLLLSPRTGFADEWSVDEATQLPPTAPENRIIKWCQLEGDGVRYASSNLNIPGYKPCGKLAVTMNCDSTGRRYIGEEISSGYTYRDCSVGPRITIERTDGEQIEAESFANDDVKPGDPDPMSTDERTDMENDLAKIEQQQQKQTQQELMMIQQLLFGGMFNPNPQKKSKRRKKRFSKSEMRKQKRELKKQLKSMDPATKKTLEAMLGVKKLEDIIK